MWTHNDYYMWEPCRETFALPRGYMSLVQSRLDMDPAEIWERMHSCLQLLDAAAAEVRVSSMSGSAQSGHCLDHPRVPRLHISRIILPWCLILHSVGDLPSVLLSLLEASGRSPYASGFTCQWLQMHGACILKQGPPYTPTQPVLLMDTL